LTFNEGWLPKEVTGWHGEIHANLFRTAKGKTPLMDIEGVFPLENVHAAITPHHGQVIGGIKAAFTQAS
jgi:hypothetical protein